MKNLSGVPADHFPKGRLMHEPAKLLPAPILAMIANPFGGVGMGTATIQAPLDPSQNPANASKEQDAHLPQLAFPRASLHHTEPAFDVQQIIDANVHQLGPFDVPAFGYMEHLYLLVQATGGVGGGANVAAVADAPWSAISSITIQDVNGFPFVGPISGFDLFLINKWGGYFFNPDPSVQPDFSNVATGVGATGNFTFGLRIPSQINRREALGALANESTAQQFKVSITLNNTAGIYATAPATTLPTVRFRGLLEAWFQPTPTDANGVPQPQTPPALGTTSYWSKASPVVAAAAQQVQHPRRGNPIRNLIYVFRDNTGARSEAMIPDPISMTRDGRVLFNEMKLYRKRRMAEQFGFPAASIDAGVLVYAFTGDLDGHPGSGELRDEWLGTLGSTRLELVGIVNNAGTIDIITNDVVPAAGVVL